MEFLLDHLPPRLHLVIASRADPALPLARLRARGDLVEIRAADLRFTPDEAASYLNGAMGLRLTAEDVTALEARTEGWIAALQLAALSMAGRDDVGSFIAGFAGDDRYVVDYLVEEVLQRQPRGRPGVPAADLRPRPDERLAVRRRHRGRTAAGPCWRPSTGTTCSWSRWTTAASGTATTTSSPTSCRPGCSTSRPTVSPSCTGGPATGTSGTATGPRRSGTRWPAVTSRGAADLIELEMPALRRDRREATIRAWLESLPSEVLRVRPVLCNALAGARMSTGTFEGVEALLQDTERWLGPDEGQSGGRDRHGRRGPGRVPPAAGRDRVHRAGLALVRGDIDATVEYGRRALDLAHEDDDLARGAASALMGLAAWSTGDLEFAHTSYADCLVDFERIDHISDVLGCSITLADIQVTQGRLRAAMRTYEQALALAARHGSRDPARNGGHVRRPGRPPPGVRRPARRQAGPGPESRARRARRPPAERLPLAGGHGAGLRGRGRPGRPRSTCSTRRSDSTKVTSRPTSGPCLPSGPGRGSVRARVDDALALGRRAGPVGGDDLSYLHEFEHVTLARALLAQHARTRDERSLDQALELLDDWCEAAEDGRRSGSVIEIRVVEALAHQRRGDLVSALASLEEALGLAEPEGYVRTFLDEGAPDGGPAGGRRRRAARRTSAGSGPPWR